VTTGSYGVHTGVGDIPWVSVDPQGVYRHQQGQGVQPGDGWFDDGLP
jgi:hypothetical protein